MPVLAGIAAAGAFVPRLRLSRACIDSATGWLRAPGARAAGGMRSCCNWDEDALTMGVEAARAVFPAARATHAPDAVVLASTTLPFADRSNATLVAEALNLPDTVQTQDCCGSLRAGTGALAFAASRRSGNSLVIASDARLARAGSPQESVYGHAAAALLVVPADGLPNGRSHQSSDAFSGGREASVEATSENDWLAVVLGIAHLSCDFVDHYREMGEPFDYALEERWVRDEGYAKLIPRAAADALRAAGVEPSDVRELILPRSAGVAKRTAIACGLTNARCDDTLWESCGDAGAAHPLLGLVHFLESAQAGEIALVVGFGQGVDAIVVRSLATVRSERPRSLAAALARGFAQTSYVRYLSDAGLLDVDFGMRAERDNRTALTVAYRKRRAVTGFIGGRCRQCSTVQFPRARVCVNPDCRATDTQEDYALADSSGRIKSFTEDWQAFSPGPPLIYGNVEFAAGGNLLMEMTDAPPGSLRAGAPVRFVFRLKDRDRLRGYRRYFWKAAPMGGGD